MTGDIVINSHAKILIMTTEIYRNMVVSKDSEIKDIAYVIFDEIHYINDIERGYVWEESVIYSPETVRFFMFICDHPQCAGIQQLDTEYKRHTVKTVVSTKRYVPLEHQFYDYELGITTLEKIREARNIPRYHHVLPD